MKTTMTEKTQSTVVEPIAAATSSAYQAYLETANERAAVTDAESVASNLNLGDCVITALGVSQRAKEHRTALCRLPGFRASSVDRLDTYALAASCADGLYESAGDPPAGLADAVATGIKSRDRFVSAARTLADWGLFPADRLDAMRNATSQQAVGEDLIALGSWFLANRAAIENRCPATRADIDAVLALGKSILEMVASRGAQYETDAANERRRVFVVLNGAYDEVRRGLSWVRWHEGDADEIAPSFHSHARVAKKGKSESPASPAVPELGGAVIKPIIAGPSTPVIIEGTTDKPVPMSNPFIS